MSFLDDVDFRSGIPANVAKVAKVAKTEQSRDISNLASLAGGCSETVEKTDPGSRESSENGHHFSTVFQTHPANIANLLIRARGNGAGAGRRAVVQFRLVGDVANAWATALGAPGETVQDVIAELRFRHGEAVIIGDVRGGVEL